MNADGTGVIPLTTSEGNDEEPDWQPIPRDTIGVVNPVNKIEILAPYLVLAGLLAAVSTIYVIKKRRD